MQMQNKGIPCIFGQSSLPGITESADFTGHESRPSLAKARRERRQTGNRKPTTLRSPKVHFHGQRGNCAAHCLINFLASGFSIPPGIVHAVFPTAPDEPVVSCHVCISSPANGPSSNERPRQRELCTIGMMMANLSTILDPSCLVIDQSKASPCWRKDLIFCAGVVQTSRMNSRFATMSTANAHGLVNVLARAWQSAVYHPKGEANHGKRPRKDYHAVYLVNGIWCRVNRFSRTKIRDLRIRLLPLPLPLLLQLHQQLQLHRKRQGQQRQQGQRQLVS